MVRLLIRRSVSFNMLRLSLGGAFVIGHLFFIAAVSIAIAVISYDSFAQSQGWPVGSILRSDASTPKIVSFVLIGWALIKAIFVFHWWSPVLILALGWFLALGLVLTLKKNTQVLCILAVFPAFALVVLYQSEARPLGFLSALF